ncbi:ATP-dependent DNA helicase RecQ-like [Mya arenaria]|uniref:ATP-dependent DNA helicase RecQ-like n=1 Tax=Mya arenaria TaxID=6604 RepID=UPI0022E39832|nr:ATP-dependent DNA helicase RecQ-like [Mya arenaria]
MRQGENDKGKVAFRKWFRHLGELRSLCPYAVLLAVSATCTRKAYKKVVKLLNFKEDALFIRMSPNKSNIKLSVRKAKSLEIAIFPVVEMIQCKQVHRLLIYCSTIKELSECYRYLVNECLEDSGVMIQMYHSETTKDIKHSVQGLLRNQDSKAIIIATSALGLGLDVANCNSVIIYGLPKSVIDLLQEMGRVGRDGRKSVAIIVYKSTHLRNANEEVRNVCTTNMCRRQELLSTLLNEHELEEISQSTHDHHSCYDDCQRNC